MLVGYVRVSTADERQSTDRFGFRYHGYLTIPNDGVYSFWTASDDGSNGVRNGSSSTTTTSKGSRLWFCS